MTPDTNLSFAVSLAIVIEYRTLDLALDRFPLRVACSLVFIELKFTIMGEAGNG
jgi:hypothetical protein